MTNEQIIKRLAAIERAIANYEELDSDMDSPEYIARGNGFCDSKYSEDFIEGQLEKLRKEKAELQERLRMTKEQKTGNQKQ